ncbi:head-tail connector protein [Burkholderia ubonensis]|uniref:head-tail connector protein n=1 Tax=Burkholderia ubonensis TaxID=101571 RepID=UPI00076C66E0|nr:head-tail connector protein [Burkholderia ubonensis]KVO88530.1 hypothetical protein WJ80_07750 [Burkholderia ubonensis]
MIDLARAKLHCRVDGDEEDALIEGYIGAARIGVEKYLKRKLYDTPEALAAAEDPSGLVVDDAHEHAMLLLIGEWYAHRESSGPATGELPHAVTWLISSDRFYTV